MIGFDDFENLPSIQYEWNSFLLVSIIKKYELGFRLVSPVIKDRRYNKEIIVLKDSGYYHLDDIVYNLLAKNGINFIDESNLLSFLVINHLVSKVIPKEFILPEPNDNNDRAISYLNKNRKISLETIQYFIDKGLIYESSEHHDIIFKGLDAEGIVRFASMRGSYDIEGKKPFKIDVAGNDKHYGFNLTVPNSDIIFVFEGAIDLISYADMFHNYNVNLLALGMLQDPPLERFLEEHPGMKFIFFCLDNDQVGRMATDRLMKKYQEAGYEVRDFSPPKKHKDMNEWLVATKLEIPCHENGDKKLKL